MWFFKSFNNNNNDDDDNNDNFRYVSQSFYNSTYLYAFLVYDAIFKEREEDKHLQELEERFLQKRKNSPDFRY